MRGRENCQDDQPCLTHFLWMDLNQQLYSYLSGISLAGLVEQDCVRAVAERQEIEAGYGSEFPYRITTKA
jgi:Rrf2 family iron-sulfur cluster assembly transcriptional regulator